MSGTNLITQSAMEKLFEAVEAMQSQVNADLSAANNLAVALAALATTGVSSAVNTYLGEHTAKALGGVVTSSSVTQVTHPGTPYSASTATPSIGVCAKDYLAGYGENYDLQTNSNIVGEYTVFITLPSGATYAVPASALAGGPWASAAVRLREESGGA